MLIDSDIPYLEPLLLHLRTDPNLQDQFTEKSFFMPHIDLINATAEVIGSECVHPRALWILPGDSIATTQQEGCMSPSKHTFHIQIIVQCIRDQFQISKKDDKFYLNGQAMELFTLRKMVKKSVSEFAIKWKKDHARQKFEKISWVKDIMQYPDDESPNKFLATAIEFSVTIF